MESLKSLQNTGDPTRGFLRWGIVDRFPNPLLPQSTAGWWYTYPSEKYEFVSWDDSSQYDGKVMSNSMVPVSTNQKSG